MIFVNARFLTQPVTGVQRYALEISKRLRISYNESELCFLTPANIINHQDAAFLKAKVVGRLTGHIWEQIELPFYIKKDDLLINLCNTAPILQKKKIITIHDIAFEVFPETYSKRFLIVYKWLIPKLAKSALIVLTVSKFSKSELINYYKVNPHKIQIIYNATDVAFKSIEDRQLQKNNYLLVVSSLNSRKNLLRTMQAFALVAQQNKDLKLFVIGALKSDSFEGVDITAFENHPQINVLGRVSDEDLIKYYSNARGFLYPSLYEGFGIPPLEAQACGCPVLISAASCLPEIFQDSAIYCNPLDIDSIAEGITKLIEKSTSEELRIKMKNNLKRFSWKESAEKLEGVIKEINL